MEPGLSYTHRLGLVASALLLTISQPWMRLVTPATPAAGYFTLSNNSDHQAALSGAASPDCGQVMLHASTVENHTAQMKTLHDIAVPAHGSVTFEPGGYHLMCMAPSSAIAPGRSAPITLRFQDGSTLTATFPVYGAKGK
ncbi:MAG: copper chaperone PCu(A)C [Acetobacteraceae bacterium]|jgi:periplasmic copper chaperone A